MSRIIPVKGQKDTWSMSDLHGGYSEDPSDRLPAEDASGQQTSLDEALVDDSYLQQSNIKKLSGANASAADDASASTCANIFSPEQAVPCDHIPPPREFRRLQDTDQGLQHWTKHHQQSDSPFNPKLSAVSGTYLWTDSSSGCCKILVPSSLQRAIFDSVHQISHPCYKPGYAILKQRCGQLVSYVCSMPAC